MRRRYQQYEEALGGRGRPFNQTTTIIAIIAHAHQEWAYLGEIVIR